MRKACLTFFIFHFSLFICYALEFGLVLNQSIAIGNEAAKLMNGFEYRADIWPSLTYLIGDTGEFHASAGLTLGLKGKQFSFVPELMRTDIFFSFGNWGIMAGRMLYADPLGLISTGLFDGARLSYNSTMGSFGIGVWYTGLLYKKNANITMTEADKDIYGAALDYGDFFNTYFAPRRLLVSLDWEHPSLMEKMRLKAAIMGQVDLSGNDTYHSQYLTVKAIIPIKNIIYEFGGSIELAESDKFNIAFAVDLGVFWTLPTAFYSRLSLTGRYASGGTDGIIGVFNPVTNKFHGNIINAKLPGISMLTLGYTARINQVMGASVNVAYFIRNDLGTFNAWPVRSETGFFLGPELYGQFVWSPYTDIQVNFGAGVFIPSLGNAGPNVKPRWRMELTAIIALL
ncbi:MAG: hypothetical protein LBI14_03315 [Treponema sp.]|jgi:hypothetical protein|nr:hypothetical protein [Treponema sp.]